MQHTFTYTENDSDWITFQVGMRVVPNGFYVFSKFHKDLENFKIDDPSNRIYCLIKKVILTESELGGKLAISTTSGKVDSMKRVYIEEKLEGEGDENCYNMTVPYVMTPETTFVSFVHYPSKYSKDCLVKMVRYDVFLKNPNHYTRLADQIRNDAFLELAIASVDDSSLLKQLSQWNRSDNEFFKESSEEILKRRAKDVHILELIERHAKEEQKREEERVKKEKQARHDEYLRQCEYERRRRQDEIEELNRKKTVSYETNYEENEYHHHYQPKTYYRKR